MAKPDSDPFARRAAETTVPTVPTVPVAPAPAAPVAPVAQAQLAQLEPQALRVPRAALSSGRRWRQAARWIGLVMFGVGAGLLGYVFVQAMRGFQQFQQPDYLSQQFDRASGAPGASGASVQSLVQAAVGVLGTQALSVLYLLLLGFLASAIASKGIQFFAASEAVIDEAVASVE